MRHGDAGAAADMQQMRFVLVELCLDPHPRQIRHRVQLHGGLDLVALDHVLRDDPAAGMRRHGDCALHRPALLEFGNECGRHVEQLEPTPRRTHEFLDATARVGVR